jgi:hypothetical protein
MRKKAGFEIKNERPAQQFIGCTRISASKMIEEELNDEEQQEDEPEVKRFTDKDLVRVMSILFVFAIYFFIFLKILVLE